MPARAAHTIHADCHHIGWDNALPPALTVAPGDTHRLWNALTRPADSSRRPAPWRM